MFIASARSFSSGVMLISILHLFDLKFHTMNYVKLVSTFYDSTGMVVGTDFIYANVDVLRPAEKSSFEIILNDVVQSQKSK
jgi:hypothetical protein